MQDGGSQQLLPDGTMPHGLPPSTVNATQSMQPGNMSSASSQGLDANSQQGKSGGAFALNRLPG